MNNLHIITPVKDSIESTLQTLRAICASDLPGAAHSLTVYNDFSTLENTARLAAAAKEMGFTLVNLADLTDHPSPNYLLVLQTASCKALEAGADLIIVESDVTVAPDTLHRLHEAADARPDCSIMAAVTVDDQGAVNYPYLYAKGYAKGIAPCKKHCSFCCSLLLARTPAPLRFRQPQSREELVRRDDFARRPRPRTAKLPCHGHSRRAPPAPEPPVEATQIYQPSEILLEKVYEGIG